MKKYRIALISGLLIFFGLSAFIWKEDPIKSLIKSVEQKLQTYRVNLHPEKIYVHLDKTQYVAGETLWLKTYLVNAMTNEPIAQEKVLHIELLNEQGEAVQNIKLSSTDGKVEGSLSLPDTLVSGKYQLVAYTEWMRNFDEAQFFYKTIHIWDAQQKKQSQQQRTDEQQVHSLADLQFFPEGGGWVAGIASSVAFKAIDRQGLGVAVSGKIQSQAGETIATFESKHAGMGAITMMPEPGESYVAVVKNTDGIEHQYELPEIQAEGYVLSVDEYGEQDQLMIEVKSNVTEEAPLLLTIIGGDRLLHTEEITAQHLGKPLSIAASEYPMGISRITLASAKGEPLVERLVFLHPEQQLKLNVHMNEPEYLKKEKVTLTLETTDEKGKPVPANLSMAITDEELVPGDLEKRNILSHLLLTSDLKGYVEQPDYYFEDITDEKKQILSYVMMTHGWRRFNWNEELPQVVHRQQAALSINGKLVTENDNPVENGEVILYVKDQPQIFLVENTDENGHFSFEGFDFMDSVDFVIQGTTAKGKRNVKVLMDKNDNVPDWNEENDVMAADQLLASTGNFVARSANQATVEKSLQPNLKEMLLKEIVVQERREQLVEPFRLHSQADVVIDAKDLPTAPSGNILQSLQGRIPGVQIYSSGMFDYRAQIRGSGSPLYLIDGMPVDATALNGLNQFDLDRIEVLKGPSAAIYGGRGSGGVIAFFTKRGGTQYEETEPSNNIIIHKGYGFSRVKEFYSPKYTAEGKTDLPDYRTTLYWNPNVQTDKDGKATVSFYTADRNTRYRVIINGITEGGKAVSGEQSFVVKSPKEVAP